MKKRPKKQKQPTESDLTYEVFKWGSPQEPSSGLKAGRGGCQSTTALKRARRKEKKEEKDGGEKDLESSLSIWFLCHSLYFSPL